MMRFQGNAMYAMKGIMSGVLLNLILAPTAYHLFCLRHHGCRHCYPHQSVLRLRHAFLDVAQGSEHPNPSSQLHANQGLHQGDHLWRHAFLIKTGLGKHRHPGAECGCRSLWRCSHCGYEYRDENLLLHLCRCHRSGTGFPAPLRFLLWCQVVLAA